MNKIDATSDAIGNLSSKIRSITMMQVGAVVAVLLATIVGYGRLQEAKDKSNAFKKFESERLPYINALQQAWEYDASVIYYKGDSYVNETLSKVSVLLLVETLFIGDIQLKMKNNHNFDNKKADKTAREIGDFAQMINRLRQTLPTLKVAVVQGRQIEDFSHIQLRAYHQYLMFHEEFSKTGSFEKVWTKVCKTAAVAQHLAKTLKWSVKNDDMLQKVIMSPRGIEALKWANEQLIRQSEAPGDFISQLEYFGSDENGALVMGLLELAGEVRSFKTPRSAAIELSYGFLDQQKAKAVDIDRLLDRLKKTDQESLANARMELERRKSLAKTLDSERHVSIPFINVEIPRNQLWFLPLVNIALLGTLFRLREKAFALTNQLVKYGEEWWLTMELVPYNLIYSISSRWFWLWEFHYLVFGLFGLCLATVFIYTYPPEYGLFGWFWLFVSYLVACVLTMTFWVRFRHPDIPHELEQFHLFNRP
jgi:hypothetical protein